MKHRYFFAFSVAIFAMGLGGCKWDSGLYDDLTNDGQVTSCPGFEQLVMSNGMICKKGIDYANCSNVDISECDKCSEIRRLKQAFDNGICPKNFICNESEKQCWTGILECEENVCNKTQECKNADNRCGEECLDCNTENNASKGNCDVKKGICTITACALTFHMVEDGGKISCAKNTFEQCGKQDSTVTNNCKNEGTMNGTCDDGKCIATECAASHYLIGGACVENTETTCGSSTNDCTQLAGWVGGSCVGGKCVATSCAQNHCLNKGTCVHGAMNALACGVNRNEPCQNCAKDDMRCANGICTESSCEENVCDRGDGKCENDTSRCGMGCLNCSNDSNATAGICDAKGECVATACKPDHHLKDGKCDSDTVDACGSPDNICTKLDGWVSGDCVGKKCIANVCLSEYHLDDGVCVKDNANVCGETKKDCTAQEGWVNGTCAGGNCQADECIEKYCVDKNACVHGLTERMRCGRDGGECKDCSSDFNKAFCFNGICSECAVDDDCTAFRGWSNVKCRNGQCVPDNCDGMLQGGVCVIKCSGNPCRVGEECLNSASLCRCNASEGPCSISDKCCKSRTENTYSCKPDSDKDYICPP